MKLINLKIYLLVVITITMFSACSASKPSLSNAKKVFEISLGQQFIDGFVKVIDFKKVNGLAMEKGGVKLYKFEYAAEVVYPKGFNVQCIDPEGLNKFKASASCMISAAQGGIPRSIGEAVNKEGVMIFTKKEKGWEGEIVNEMLYDLMEEFQKIK